MRRGKRLAFSALVVILIILVGLELTCRLYLGLGDPPLSRTDPQLEYMFVGPKVYHRFGNTIEYNSFNMRTHEFVGRRTNPQELRILFFGDSVINGGALTDQKDVVTSRIERRLIQDYQRPAVVMNVSAGSWGPPNYTAYMHRFGTFESNVMVIVVSNHDFADAPDWSPVVGVSPDFPDKKPMFALQEAVMRYLPRYLPHFPTASETASLKLGPQQNFCQGQIDQCMDAFRELIRTGQQRNIQVIVAQHFEQPEYGQPEWEGHALFRKAAQEFNVPNVQMAETFAAAMKAGKSPYRDVIHPNTYGHELMSNAIYPEIVKALHSEGIDPPK